MDPAVPGNQVRAPPVSVPDNSLHGKVRPRARAGTVPALSAGGKAGKMHG
jgi:hypothetical protein